MLAEPNVREMKKPEWEGVQLGNMCNKEESEWNSRPLRKVVPNIPSPCLSPAPTGTTAFKGKLVVRLAWAAAALDAVPRKVRLLTRPVLP